jgi:hypothetical protein
MPDPRIKCGADKSGMTNVKMKGFSKLLYAESAELVLTFAFLN